MLQQGKLWVIRREKEGPSGVHLDSQVRRVKGMNLCVKCSIKISDRKIEMFHLPGHGISLSPFLNVHKVPKGSTARGKQVSILQFAVEVVDKQSNYLPFFIIKGCKQCIDACPYFCTTFGFSDNFALKEANHISSIIKWNFGKPCHAFDVDLAFDGHSTGKGIPTIQAYGNTEIFCCALTQWGISTRSCAWARSHRPHQRHG